MSDVIRVRAGNVLRLEAEIFGKPEPKVGFIIIIINKLFPVILTTDCILIFHLR